MIKIFEKLKRKLLIDWYKVEGDYITFQFTTFKQDTQRKYIDVVTTKVNNNLTYDIVINKINSCRLAHQ